VSGNETAVADPDSFAGRRNGFVAVRDGLDVANGGTFDDMIRALLVLFCAADPGVPRALSLSQAIEIALAHQPTVRQARANTDAAEGRVEQARSGYLPQVGATATYLRTTANFTPRPGTSTTLQRPSVISGTTFNFFNFGVAANQLIYDFGQTSGRKRSAEAGREAFRASEQTTELQVILAVRRAYFQVLAQDELVRVTNDALANQRKHLTQTEGLVRAGMRPDIDLARVRTDLANARLLVINAENGVSLGKTQLAQTMGLESDGFTLQNEESSPVPGEDGATEPLLETALAGRPELVSLARARRAQEESIRALRGAYGPSLSANASANEAGTGLDKLVPNWAVGAVITWPFLQGGLTRGQLHEARAALASINAQADGVRLQVQVDVQQAQLAVRAAKAGGVAAEEAVVNAREQLRLAEGRYVGGLGNAIELGDAQVAFTNAQAQAVQAHYNLATARAQLSTALGKR
jgi:outer membrane protein